MLRVFLDQESFDPPFPQGGLRFDNLFMIFLRRLPRQFKCLFEDLGNFATFNNNSKFFFPVCDHDFVVKKINLWRKIKHVFGNEPALAKLFIVKRVAFSILLRVRKKRAEGISAAELRFAGQHPRRER